MNAQIRARQVRVVDAEGVMRGVMPLADAQALADVTGMDLVEVAATAEPPVCRVLDYAKFAYAEARRRKEASRKAPTAVKTVKFGMNISGNDLAVKTGHARDFLARGHRVTLIVDMRGRERAHPERAVQFLNDILASLERTAPATTSPNRVSATVG